MNHTKPIEILLVEDNPGDVRLTQEAFLESRLGNRLQVVGDGVEALEFLRKEGKYANALEPDLVLLDLNLPRKDGRETLLEIKSDPKLRRIPVIILTTSKAEEDIVKTYDAHANCFISKPVDFGEFLKVVQQIEEFWFAIVKLPPHS